ncbi:hypothetical protein OSB04_018822 [Centaurea solstitialis]|uniref:Integrase catalytic domain-containing protein n=1 Tax=Centaurea solstitialis TaxID=347529 RepID=A0AA38SQR0_9ASTR|nr:hypothetical protein OSB04_018822 [Centaurea solstitialis]
MYDNYRINSQHSAPSVVGSGHPLPITRIGNCSITPNITLHDILVVPNLTRNLLSISRLTRDYPINVVFSDDFFTVQNRVNGRILATGRCDGGLYLLQNVSAALLADFNNKTVIGSYKLWHERLGRVNHSIISILSRQGHLSVSSILPNPTLCGSCQLAKSHKLPFAINENRSLNPLDMIHCDIWGPAPIRSVEGYRYYIIFIDDHSRFVWLYAMKLKSECYDIFIRFQQFVENQLVHKIKVFHSDGGAEFTSNRFQSHLLSCGILHQMSCPYTPSHNGRAERKHRHITETGLAMLFHSKVPMRYWFSAFTAAVFTINRLPTKILSNLSPYEILFGKAPNYHLFHPYGCRVFPCLKDYMQHKFVPRSRACIFIGYNSHHKGFVCLDESNFQIYINRHAKFDELHFPYVKESTAQLISDLDYSAFLVPTETSSVSVSQHEKTHRCATSAKVCPLCTTDLSPAPTSDSSSPSPSPDPGSGSTLSGASGTNYGSSDGPTSLQSSHPMQTRFKSGIFKPKYPALLVCHNVTPI